MNTNIHRIKTNNHSDTLWDTPNGCFRAKNRLRPIRHPLDFIGRCLNGRYHLVKQVGVGGMAVVYKAIQISTNRTVAIKVLMPERAQELNLVEQFTIEARAARRLRHPNIVDVFEHGRDGDLRYIAMEYLQGETLESLLRRKGSIGLGRAAAIVNQVLSSLSEAHSKGVFHLDIKPGNVFLQPGDFVKIIDFGLAKVLGRTFPTVAKSIGAVFGSPRFMSPEQCTKNQPDHRSDIYSVGVLLWSLVLGQPPFNGESTTEILRQHVRSAPPSFGRIRPDLTIPRPFESIVRRALAKQRERRFPNAMAFQRALRPFTNNLRIEFPPLIRQEANASL